MASEVKQQQLAGMQILHADPYTLHLACLLLLPPRSGGTANKSRGRGQRLSLTLYRERREQGQTLSLWLYEEKKGGPGPVTQLLWKADGGLSLHRTVTELVSATGAIYIHTEGLYTSLIITIEGPQTSLWGLHILF